MDDLKIEMGKRIARIRKLKGLTQSQLGDKVRLSYEIIGKCERGEREITALELKKIAQVLDVPQEFITDDIPENIKDKDFKILDKTSLYEKAFQSRAREQAIAYHAQTIMNLWDICQYYLIDYTYTNGSENSYYQRLKGSIRKMIRDIRSNKFVTEDNIDNIQKLMRQLSETFLSLLIDYEKLDKRNRIAPKHFSKSLQKDLADHGYLIELWLGY